MATLECIGDWDTEEMPDGLNCSGSINIDSASPSGVVYSCDNYDLEFFNGTNATCADAGGFQAVGGGSVTTTGPSTHLYCDGTLSASAEGAALCSGDWVQSVGVTIEQIFAYPIAADGAAVWMAGFGLPMMLYLVSWGYGVVVNFFSPKQEDIN